MFQRAVATVLAFGDCSTRRDWACYRIAASNLVNRLISVRTCGAAFLQVLLLTSSFGNRQRAQAMDGSDDAGEQITADRTSRLPVKRSYPLTFSAHQATGLRLYGTVTIQRTLSDADSTHTYFWHKA